MGVDSETVQLFDLLATPEVGAKLKYKGLFFDETPLERLLRNWKQDLTETLRDTEAP
jgi:hypothetical protein